MAITATFQANFDQFVAAVKSADNALHDIQGSAKTLGTAIATSLASTEIRRFASDVKIAAADFIGAFTEEQAAVSRLTAALRAQGTFTPELAQRYAELGAAFQKTTRFSDDAIFGVQALLVQVGTVMPDQMGEALTAVTNLAAGMGPHGGGLEGAALLVAKAFSSDGESLGRLKILLGDSIQPGASMAEVLQAINSKFGGQAAADRQTAIGQFEGLKNTMSDFKERVGELLVNALTPLLNAFAGLPESMQTAIVAVVTIGTVLAPVILSFAAMVTVLTPLVPLIGVALTGALAALAPFLGPASLIILGIGAVYLAFRNWDRITDIVRNVYEGIKTWLVDRFTSVVESIRSKVDAVSGFFKGMYDSIVGRSSVPDTIDGIQEQVARLDSVMVQPVAAATDQVVAKFRSTSEAVRLSWSEAMDAVRQGMGVMQSAMQVAVPAGFSYQQAYSNAGYVAHGSLAGGDVYRGHASGFGSSPINNTFNIVDTEANIARRVSEHLTQSVLQGRRVSA